MEFFINLLIEWSSDNGPSRVERVLWIAPEGTCLYMIDIHDSKAWPVYRRTDDLTTDLTTKAARVLDSDPYASLIRPENQINPKHRAHRDKYWQLIEPLVNAVPQTFQRFGKNSLVHKIVKRCKRKGTAYEQLRRYWQRGQTKNALLPMFERCGWRAPGKDEKNQHRVRTTKEGVVPTTKLGNRTRARVADKSVGINVDEDVLRCFRAGRDLKYENRKGVTKRAAYQKTLELFFQRTKTRTRDGQEKAVVRAVNEIPTYRQFRYWLAKDYSPTRSQKSRKGEHKFNLTGRAILGDSTQMAMGPGSIFQIDSTIGDCYLVSSLDRNRIIGRPVVFLCIDLFSRLIVGFSIGLEGGWVGAMLALYNACSDKVSFCAEYGVTIEKWEWPSCHFPEGLMADRGELEGYNADHLVNAFGVRVHNTAPGRADLKGVVERYIGRTNEKVIKWVPGAVRKRERGDKDYRLDAVLDLHDLRKLIIVAILHHNKSTRLEKYRLDEDMIADHVEPVPVDLWSWGIKNRSGHLRKFSDDRLRLNLLPEVEASIKRNGLHCEGLYYTCDLAIREEWFERAREAKCEKVKLARDPRNLTKAYLRLDGGRRMEVCELVEADHTFFGRDWYEMAEEFEVRKQRSDDAKYSGIDNTAELNAYAEDILASAEEKTKDQRQDMSDSARVAGITKNRKLEKSLERKANAWILGNQASDGTGDSSPESQITADPSIPGYVPPAQPMDKLRRAREERI
jgi:hypothetical protein